MNDTCRRPTTAAEAARRRRLFLPALSSVVFVTATSVTAYADVSIETTALRNYELPPSFELTNGAILAGPNDSTILANTMGATPEASSCGVVIAEDDAARLVEIRYEDAPTQCIGVIPHPDGGFFVRGSNPLVEMGEVSGFTMFIGADDQEVWSVSDDALVGAAPKPNGTGEFQGAYVTPHDAMAYSPQLDKLLGFTISKLTIGLDEKFLSQAHVINVESGRLAETGQTFGLSGVGNVGGVTTRTADGQFLIYYYSSGDRGAFFYTYNGRESIEFFKPRGEDWDDRFVLRMIYTNDLLHLLWTPTDDPGTETRVTATTDAGAELWSATLPSEYRFADGELVELGQPLLMWVTDDHVAVLHQDPLSTYLRVLDRNGEQLGVARLDDATEFAPIAIVNGPDDTLTLVSFDQDTRIVYEDTLEFVDVEDFDPDAGIPDGGIPGDVGIPADIGVRDVLEAAGCCATASGPSHGDERSALLALIAAAMLVVRNRRRR